MGEREEGIMCKGCRLEFLVAVAGQKTGAYAASTVDREIELDFCTCQENDCDKKEKHFKAYLVNNDGESLLW
jgi:hypothetical protein